MPPGTFSTRCTTSWTLWSRACSTTRRGPFPFPFVAPLAAQKTGRAGRSRSGGGGETERGGSRQREAERGREKQREEGEAANLKPTGETRRARFRRVPLHPLTIQNVRLLHAGAAQRHFIYVEIGFFARWWDQQPPKVKDMCRTVVKRKQLEFINGGWCVPSTSANTTLPPRAPRATCTLVPSFSAR